MISETLNAVFLNNSILSYLISAGVFIAGIFTVIIIKNVVLRKLKQLTEKTPSKTDDLIVNLIRKWMMPVLYYGVFYLSVRNLVLNSFLSKAVASLGYVILIFCAAQLGLALIILIVEKYWMKTHEGEADRRAYSAVFSMIKLVVWSIAVIVLLDNLGIKITALVAGLGITGVAAAMAAQAILGDLFSYFAIFFDRPFEIGDFIIVGDYLGVVEHVGIKTTRIRSLGGEQLIFSNSDLTNSRVRNYKRMGTRRVVFRFGVVYQTPLKKLKEIPGVVQNIIKSIKNTNFDRAHFFAYGDFSLVFEVVYYVIGSDYNVYMDIQQEINFAIKEEFEKRGIEFAFPTQTVYVNK